MKLTIYDVYVLMESQEQCDRMLKLCIDNELPYWKNKIAFEILRSDKKPFFGFMKNTEFYVFDSEDLQEKDNEKYFTQVTEQEFINLLNTK